MPKLIITEERLKAVIHFRTVDVPCCGNCKWHKDTPYECPECLNEKNMYVTYEGGTKYNAVFFPEKHEVCDNFEWKERKDFADMPSTTDEILVDLRTKLTPKDDPFGAEEAGLFLGNCGWTAFYGELNTDSALDMTYKTSYEAAAALWKFFFEKRGNKRALINNTEDNPK